MIILGKFNEFAPNMGFPSINDYLMDKPYDSKEKIIDYMLNGSVHMVTASKPIDIFTGNVINYDLVFMDDGEYSWTSKLIYYVDKYNLKLPEDFINHIMNN